MHKRKPKTLADLTLGAQPNRLAIAEPDGSTATYRELEAQSNEVAAQLQRNGMEPGSVVSMVIDRVEEAAVTLPAISTVVAVRM